jgi:uncharacterized membrane protein
MSMMQSFRDGFRVPWQRLFALGWFAILIGAIAVFLWLSGGWRPFAALAGVMVAVAISVWAHAVIADK